MTDYMTLLAILSSMIMVPLIWLKLRGEKAGDPEGGYPDPTIRPYPSEKFGEFKGEGLSPSDLPVFGLSRSGTISRVLFYATRVAASRRDKAAETSYEYR